MIYKNTATDGKTCLATLAIKIARPSQKPIEVFYNGFCETQRKAIPLFEKWMKKWIREELGKFANQRERALASVGLLTLQMISRISLVRNLSKCNYDHLVLCQAIIKHQEELRMLIPSSNSPHYGWHFIIDEIIHYAHEQSSRNHENQVYYESLHK